MCRSVIYRPMPSDPPFIDPTSRSLDTDQILYEAIPIASLIALFAGTALLPLLLVLAVGGGLLGAVFTAAAQFVLAVGAGVVLLYVIVRADQLS
jgi:hypothetical protein